MGHDYLVVLAVGVTLKVGDFIDAFSSPDSIYIRDLKVLNVQESFDFLREEVKEIQKGYVNIHYDSQRPLERDDHIFICGNNMIVEDARCLCIKVDIKKLTKVDSKLNAFVKKYFPGADASLTMFGYED